MKKINTSATLLASALALAGLAASGLSGCHDANSKTPDAQAAGGPPVSAALVASMAVNETQEFSGHLEAIEKVDIRSRVGGFITAVNFKPGSEVKKGDILFVIDARAFEAEMVRSEAALASNRAKMDLAKLELARAEKLLADKAIAKREFDEKASQLKEYDANARAAAAQYEAAKLNVGFTQVRAPINGRVGKAEITVGNLIDASSVLTSLVSMDKMYASFNGDEETFLRVGTWAQQGTGVVVKAALANESGFPHQGKLEFVDNQLDAQTGSVRMRAVFENGDKTLVPGLFARIQLDTSKPGNKALLINEKAVGNDQSRKFVYVVANDNKIEYRPVTLGPMVDGMRVVRSGLKAGEKVVVNGLQRVRPGASVTPEMVAMDFDPANPAKAVTTAKADKQKDVQ